MAAVAIDSLEYAHQLEAVGMPREQVEAVAKGLTSMFIHNFESLVTRDYLDTRFSEFETGINANIDKRFTQVDKHFAQIDKRFTELGNRLTEMKSTTDMRFVTLESKMDRRFDGLEIRFASIDGKFSRIHLMFGLTMATATIPILQNFFG